MSGFISSLSDNLFAALLDIVTYMVIFFAKSVMSLAILAILIYIFAGWIKAMLGAAFAPIALVVAPLDRGRLLGSSVGFVMGGIASYAFTLATGLLMLKMFTVGADKMLASLSQNGVSTLTGTATYALGFAIMALVLSVLMLLVVFNAKNWGAEFFGSAAFDMSSRVLNQALGKAVAAGSIKGGKIAARATEKAAGAAAVGAAVGAGAAGAALAGAAGGVIGGAVGGAEGKKGFFAKAAGIMRGAVRGMSPGAQAAFQQSPSGQRASQAMQAAASRVRAATSKARQTAAAPARYASTGYQAGKSATLPKTPPS